MKIIVNSKTFAEKIKEAFDVDAHFIQWYGNDGELLFNTRKYQADIKYTTERQYGVTDNCRFNNLGMAKLMLFLKTLKEQPIVLTLEDENICVEQAVIYFQ